MRVNGEQLNLERLIDELRQPARAAVSADALIAAGKRAVPPLARLARTDQNIEARGWALICLSEIADPRADMALMQLSEDPHEDTLVRTWAAAARVARCRNAAELERISVLLNQLPALERPLVQGWLSLLATTGDPALIGALQAITVAPALRAKLLPAIVQRDPATLALVLAHAGDDNVRRMAAACLATQGLDADWRTRVPQVVIGLYTFERSAEQVPWAGGALFIPGLQWSRATARSLVQELLCWQIWCEQHGLDNQKQQLHNNLRSLQLAAAAGYASPGWQVIGTDAWLTLWGQTVGRDALEDLLERAGVRDDLRYLRIWSRLPREQGD